MKRHPFAHRIAADANLADQPVGPVFGAALDDVAGFHHGHEWQCVFALHHQAAPDVRARQNLLFPGIDRDDLVDREHGRVLLRIMLGGRSCDGKRGVRLSDVIYTIHRIL